MNLAKAFEWRALSIIAKAEESRVSIRHDGLYGDNNEGLIIEALRDFLGEAWSVASGEVVDVAGSSSNQCDVIIYDPRLLPAIYRSATGKVIVPLHCVGAVIEVKSNLRSGSVLDENGNLISDSELEDDGKKHTKGDCQLLCEQLVRLKTFMDAGYRRGNEKLKDAHAGIHAQFFNNCSPPVVLGLCYSMSLLPETGRKAFKRAGGLLGEDLWIVALDVERPAPEVQDIFDGAKSKGDLLKAAEEIRLPNGFFFDLKKTYDVGHPSLPSRFECQAISQKSESLRFLFKVLKNFCHENSPTRAQLSRAEWEVVFDAYHGWMLG